MICVETDAFVRTADAKRGGPVHWAAQTADECVCRHTRSSIIEKMPYPIKTCVVCGEEFELKPGKPGFANRCPDCSEEESAGANSSDPLKSDKGANAARREAMKNLLYRKDS